jgi:hypothetical protein
MASGGGKNVAQFTPQVTRKFPRKLPRKSGRCLCGPAILDQPDAPMGSRTRREDISLREPSSSDRKNVAPLEPCRCAAVLQARGIAQINKRRLG